MLQASLRKSLSWRMKYYRQQNKSAKRLEFQQKFSSKGAFSSKKRVLGLFILIAKKL